MNLLTRAICFAAEKHEGQTRKGSGVPYIVHPVEVVAIAASVTEDETVQAAAALHDVVEDCGVTPGEIVALFGARVAKLVAADTEEKREELPAADTWKQRKQETVDALLQMERDGKIIVLSDKLSNLRSLSRDYAQVGDALWGRFNCKVKAEHAWYYRSIRDALQADFGETQAFRELAELIDKIFA